MDVQAFQRVKRRGKLRGKIIQINENCGCIDTSHPYLMAGIYASLSTKSYKKL